ncbi:hypothetical protein N646_1114 [Vibrio alginolyticus NBRC 15630 = ATCC 17749]|uniref:Uncharacterized protein n=1 Tax=Vibrio alginolyticus (strain ATCC 17749 / DSM 2171 / NBRC 15630 / NCIMB 1903 / NCTC 12160 / XII-53) TaxID=1219076 RepID=A0A2I3C702_VIBAX|nr:hypothetical protein N646_1114 [Vibrio alginolyticus NBRC 15630 = ATCC 17749]
MAFNVLRDFASDAKRSNTLKLLYFKAVLEKPNILRLFGYIILLCLY